MKLVRLLSFLCFSVLLLCSDIAMAQTTVTIGTGTSSSSTRGPFQRADTNSTTVYSRWVQIFTAAELAAAGIPNGATISAFNWEGASPNLIIGTGDANLKIYVRNSTATSAMSDTWVNHITGSTLAFDQNFNTTNNFPGVNGWIPFTLTTPITYTGGALEIAVDWDCSQVSTPAFSGNGALKFRWHSTAPDDLVVKKTSSSAPSTNITDLKDERANIQIVYTMGASCDAPTNLNASNRMETSADLNWAAATGATSYNWKVVAAGAGSGGTAVASGSGAATTATATGLTGLTSYDLFVESDCGGGTVSAYAGPYTFATTGAAINAYTIGAGTSSSSTRGPFQRSDTNSSTVYSRFVHVYTAAELAAAGIMNGDVISSLNWELASSNVVIGSGNATLKVYAKNSMATAAVSDTWVNHISGATMVVDNAYNTTNNFPGMNGWMGFPFAAPFTYTGGALEIAVDWDCSQVSTPAFSGDGSLKWRWESTAPDDLVVKKTSSSAPSTNITDLKNERANIQIVTSSAAAPVDSVDITFMINTANITVDSAGIFVAGGVIGDPGEHPLADSDNDGVWTGVVRKPKGIAGHYIFLNGNCANYSCKEQLGGLPCSDPNNFNDRSFPAINADTTIMTCFGSCSADTTCPAPPAMVDVTFKVDMTLETTNTGGVFLGGNFENWSGNTALADIDNDSIWEVTVSLTENTLYEFKFINGPGWAGGGEQFDPSTIDSVCTLTSGAYTNRVFSTGTSDTATIAYCYNHCFDCATVNTDIVPLTAAFEMMPNPANDYVRLAFSEEYLSTEKTILVQNSVGQTIVNETVNHVSAYRLNTQGLANGMYFITVQTEEGIQTKRLIVNH